MIRILLARHPKVDMPAGLYGATDVPVADSEMNKIAKSISDIEKYDHIISSPKQRCRLLAEQITLLGSNQPAIDVIDELKEMDFGDLDGVSFDELEEGSDTWQRLSDFWHEPADFQVERGEQLAEFYLRVTQCWDEICQRLVEQFGTSEKAKFKSNKELETIQTVLVVTHGGVIRMLVAHIMNLDWKSADLWSKLNIQNGSLTEVTLNSYQGKLFCRINSIGCVRHLNDD